MPINANKCHNLRIENPRVTSSILVQATIFRCNKKGLQKCRPFLLGGRFISDDTFKSALYKNSCISIIFTMLVR